MDVKAICLLQLALIGGVISHSWIACTDYLQENGFYWDSQYCRAFARKGKDYTLKNGFGDDKGFDHQPSENSPCETSRDDANSYNDEYPMAVYYAGQRVVIAHPTKNHVAEKCPQGYDNIWIRDSGNFIYRSDVNAVSDPKLSEFYNNMVVDLGISPYGNIVPENERYKITTYPKEGKQNAPKFCENNDKALSTNVFYIPPGLQSGRYTFMWRWDFNSVGDTYTTCWEVDIVATKAERDTILTNRNQPLTDPPVNQLNSSVAIVPPGITTQTAQPPTQGPATTAGPATTQAPQPSTEGPATTAGPATTGQPCGQCPTVPPTLNCLDTCLHQCYGSP